MTRINAARAYLAQLSVAYDALEAERQRLLLASTRVPEIQAEKAEILVDAQAALDKLNALQGTSFTLTQARKWFEMPAPTPEIP